MIKKYFVCHRHRNTVDLEFVKNFYKKNEYTKLHKFKKDALLELKNGFYDDSHAIIVMIINDKYFKI